MTEYALVSPAGEVLGQRVFQEGDDLPPDPAMLAAHKPRFLPLEGEAPAFDPTSEVREGPTLEVDLSDSVVRRVWEVRALTPQELSERRAFKAAALKAEAERRIEAVMPEPQQRNSLALGVEMVTTYGPDPTAWPAEMQTRYAADMASWSAIKAIRQRSDELEAAIPEDGPGIAAFDPAAGWD